ncbi:ABC transporter permease [Roseobacter sinensis]|uniref:ABC transporter permease n=1 Tax=Roseobacter sinensis TaxID=2931391 RepID=A0ABT3BFE0_9RHOB|nr:ABC transporter permease [Roseobacter sp. WL0113]MCV3272305.1 ABC transporter permease [Roseobacter sp. WL0113]
MGGYIFNRVLWAVPILFGASVLSFAIIQLPPGDYLTAVMASMRSTGESVEQSQLVMLRERYGLDDPMIVQYWKWISGIVLRGDFGQSFIYNRPVDELLWERLGLTFVLAFASMIFVWLVAFPIGVYSAMRKYSVGDYVMTFIGFLGLATPNFLIALILMYVSFTVFGTSAGGLFSPEFADAPWSWARFWDMMGKIWIPVVVIGTAGTASLIRIVRANMLDELPRPYVEAARARGLSETRATVKYPLRVALNPFVSRLGWELPDLVSGATITAIVLSLPTTGPLLLEALLAQDMYLAGSFIFMLSVLTVIGTLLSDLLLAWLDPRVRHGLM